MPKLAPGAGLFLAAVALAACTRLITEELPTQPIGPGNPGVPPTPTPTKTTPVPVSSPTPTPTPTIIPTPTPTPSPSSPPTPDPTTSACVPEPPPLTRVNVKVHNDQGVKKVLDSAPIVCDGPGYEGFCEKMMNDPSRRCCPPRPEGHPQRVACDQILMGNARDTGKVGPTWTLNGKPCLNEESDVVPRCVNHPLNQYLLFAYGPGRYTACSESGSCGEIQIQ
jgi:hypothetical protein